jgi:hypothetical protein
VRSLGRVSGITRRFRVTVLTGFASKVQNRTWKQSVPSAVADGLQSRNAKLLLIMNMIASPIRYRVTVLTVSKRDVLTFEARPY